MILPKPPSRGEDVLPWAIEVQRCLAALRPQSSGTVRADVSPNGTTHHAALANSQNSAVTPLGFQAFRASTKSGDTITPKVRVYACTVNDRDEDTGLTVEAGDASGVASAGGWWTFTPAPSTTYYGVARATFDSGGTVTAARFSLLTEPDLTGAGDEETGAPPEYAYRKLFKVVVDSDYGVTIPNQYITGPQTASMRTSAWACTTAQRIIHWAP